MGRKTHDTRISNEATTALITIDAQRLCMARGGFHALDTEKGVRDWLLSRGPNQMTAE